MNQLPIRALSRRALNRRAKEQAILAAALGVFSRSGYSGASVDAVAAEAGITKPTLYQYFDSKEQLFTAMMVQKRNDLLKPFNPATPAPLVDQLHAFAWHYADTVMRPDMLALARLIIGEVQRFPEIGRAYQTSGPDKVLAGVMVWLDARRAEGLLVFDDAELAAQDLWGLILSAPRTQALYMPDAPPNRTQIARYLNNGLRVFLKAYSTNLAADLTQLEGLPSALSTGEP